MDRQLMSSIAHRNHPIAAPLDEASIRTLLEHALPRGEGRLLDVGCGFGAWPVQALTAYPAVRAEGVDVSAAALERAEQAAKEAGVADRLALHRCEAAAYRPEHRFDAVLCVGSTHAYGGLVPTLAALREHLAPGGTALVGEGFWEREPDPAALTGLGAEAEEFSDLATTVDRVRAEGWTPVYAHVSSLREWDMYEWSWTGSLSRWALDNPDHPDSAAALEAADEHRAGWLRGYRGVFGFVSLVLRRTAD
ncbi:SAM-dependent methyltransferase [Streptomyces palmae]|uniref:Class I SAM-dependent methyltransferase n=1 Tax=Streptomyces palmae TaxID=1701085 RepID=A0A4Z0HBI0_9ACTN|nr:class I SAM-dependent methyltransferase [Streptomyces palmae]TGB14443.1 class I SAM-dependent methyltransferase [Streptomyces palmae]